MSELFEDEDKAIVAEEEVVEVEADAEAEEIILDARQRPSSDARRRLEDLLEEKRLRDELEDFLDY
jgi:hypothetical protein